MVPNGDVPSSPELLGAPPAAARRKTELLSLGGCVTHDICKKAECLNLRHSDHLWRRPTIALMSRAPQQMPFLGADFPPELVRYWQDDFRKSHLRELGASTQDVLVFDLTRDVYCAFYEIEDFCFVIDPMSVKGMLWFGDHVTDDGIRSKLKRSDRRISYADTGHFEVWKSYFDEFAVLARRFGTVILNRLYFTNRVASQHNLLHGDSVEVETINFFLDEAYEYVKSTYKFIRINAIPRRYVMTGHDVPWLGPTYTHLQGEATALFAENLRGMLLGESYVPGSIFVDCAFDRVKRHEDLMRDHKTCAAARDDVAAQLQAARDEQHVLHVRLADAERRHHDLAAERDGLAAQLQATRDEQHALHARLADAERRHHDLAAERDGLAAQLRAAADERLAAFAEAGR